MSASGAEESSSDRDLKKLLGNPKITFILGKSSRLVNTDPRWTRLRERYSVCQAGRRVRIYPYISWRFDES